MPDQDPTFNSGPNNPQEDGTAVVPQELQVKEEEPKPLVHQMAALSGPNNPQEDVA